MTHQSTAPETPTITLDFAPSINLAMQQNDVPLVRRVTLTNPSAAPITDLRLRLWTDPQVMEPQERHLARLERGETVTLGGMNPPLASGLLGTATERTVGQLLVEVTSGEQVLARRAERIALLAFNEWDATAPLDALVAAFVLPNDPMVDRVLGLAREALVRAGDRDGALTGYTRGGPERAYAIAGAIYEGIASLGIGYVLPPASFEKTGQKVRFPSQVGEARLGTCLDLTFLYAACCEQAGLNPVVTLVRGHAFACVWLVPERLPEVAVRDAASLRKRIDLREMLAVELTAVCGRPPRTFREATVEGRGKLDEDAEFERAVDVAMARASGIRPLPVGRTEAKEEGAESVPRDGGILPPEGWRAPDGGNGEADRKIGESAGERLARWKARLLDLTLRNRLLNFKESKKSVRLLCPDLGALEDPFAKGKDFRILPVPEVMGAKDPRDARLYLERTGEDAVRKFLAAALEQKRLHATVEKEELDRRLLEMDRTSRGALEEGGANTLFLVLGFLRWYESESSEKPLLAPILLVPVKMERTAQREGFRLGQADEDARINVTLLKRLEQFGITMADLDPLPEDENGLDVPRILGRVRAAVKDRPRWDVVDEACLCILTFTRFLMWLDLEANTGMLRGNVVVRHLVDTPLEPFEQEAFPREERLDEELRPEETWCPVDADASQLAAVAASAGGRSFVLQGPPGTGKSQTITNLIAHEMALGRSVLFVSEKMAALNVVHSRLASVGLGAFCLEAHSTKASRDALRSQLKEAMDAAGTRHPQDWEVEARRLEELRGQLNAYARALHEERRCGWSAFRALGTLVARRESPRARLELGGPEAVDRDRLAAMGAAAGQLRRMAEEARPGAENPLRPVRLRSWRASLAGEARGALTALAEAAEAAGTRAAGPMETLGLPGPEASARELELGKELVGLLGRSPSPVCELLTGPGWEETRKRLAAWIGRGRTHDATRASLLTGWTEAFLGADHAGLAATLHEAKGAWVLKRWLQQRKVRKALAPLRRDGLKPAVADAEAGLSTAMGLRQEAAALADPVSEAARLFGPHWRGGKADWPALDAQLDYAGRFRSTVAAAPVGPVEKGIALRERWAAFAAAGPEPFGAGTASGIAALAFVETLEAVKERAAAARALLELDEGLAWGGDAAPGFLAGVASFGRRAAAAAERLQDWCAYRSAAAGAAALGLGPLAALVDDGTVAAKGLEAAFEASFAAWLLAACQEREPVLAKFHGVHHGGLVEDFRRVDVRVRDLSREAVRAKLAARLPRAMAEGEKQPKTSETGKLQRFVQGGRTSIRRLFLDCPNVLARYKPCVLMSPLSVAQFLGPDFPLFDVVVFDEASQMPVWEAVGAIARGKRLVVVGDSKQLPPTSFFDRKSADEADPEDDVVVEEESILDECLSAQIPALTLKWHYRSRHESLIAFSNRQYYEGKLLTFPSAVASAARLGVSWREVPEGIYDGGKTRTNRAEAEAVVAEVVRWLLSPEECKRTIGIVTFSLAQQTLVEDLLEKARADEPRLDPFFTREEEPVFVKNLETVQGDERDVILFSICYGPDQSGRVALRFGPLNAKGGERRLNVAVTRARQQLVVFSTLRADQINLDRTNATGVAHLKAFLDYARRGPQALADPANAAAGGSCESPFEEAVHTALAARGWNLHKQVGCSGYRIDLAVTHPERPGRYVLGIECDGANYHSSRTARDRDRLRASVLAGLGWKLHRIWSTDWWVDPARQVEKAEAAIRAAIESGEPEREPVVEAPRPPAPTAPLYAGPRVETPPLAIVPTQDGLPGREEYRVFKNVAWRVKERFYEDAEAAVLAQVIAEVVRVEGPIGFDPMASRVAKAWDIQKVTTKAASRIRGLVPLDRVVVRTAGSRSFLWARGQDPAQLRSFRVPSSSGGGLRSADEICPEEIAVAAAGILGIHVGVEEEDLLRETAKQFGIQRLGSNVRPCVLEGLELLVASGRAVRRGSSYTLA